MRNILKVAAGLMVSFVSLNAYAASIVDVQNYKRHDIAVEGDVAVKIIVRSDSLVGEPIKISIQKVDDSLFVARIVSLSDALGEQSLDAKDAQESVIVAGKSSAIVSMLAPEELVVDVISINYPPVKEAVCMAYWVGFVFDSEKGHCVQRAASGCRNPFKYKSMQKCQEARL